MTLDELYGTDTGNPVDAMSDYDPMLSEGDTVAGVGNLLAKLGKAKAATKSTVAPVRFAKAAVRGAVGFVKQAPSGEWRNDVLNAFFTTEDGYDGVDFGYTGTLVRGTLFEVYAYCAAYPVLVLDKKAASPGVIEGGTFSATDPGMTPILKGFRSVGGVIYSSRPGSASSLTFNPVDGADSNQLKQQLIWANPDGTSRMIIGRRDGLTDGAEEDLRVSQVHDTMALANACVRIGDQSNGASVNSTGQIAIGARDGTYCGVWHGSIVASSRTANNPLLFTSSANTYVNSPTAGGEVGIRNGGGKNVVFVASPVGAASQGDANSAVMGAYSTYGWGIWSGNVTPSTGNYALVSTAAGTWVNAPGASGKAGIAVNDGSKVEVTGATTTVSNDLVVSGTASLSNLKFNYTGIATTSYTNKSTSTTNIVEGNLYAWAPNGASQTFTIGASSMAQGQTAIVSLNLSNFGCIIICPDISGNTTSRTLSSAAGYKPTFLFIRAGNGFAVVGLGFD
jgi:hypothetical protein